MKDKQNTCFLICLLVHLTKVTPVLDINQ